MYIYIQALPIGKLSLSHTHAHFSRTCTPSRASLFHLPSIPLNFCRRRSLSVSCVRALSHAPSLSHTRALSCAHSRAHSLWRVSVSPALYSLDLTL